MTFVGSETRAVILAAGRGTRLREITERTPKCLLDLGKETILSRQIRLLLTHGVGPITVVAGHMAHLVENHVRDLVGVSVIVNRDYAVTDNVYSMYLAVDAVRGHSFVLINGDVVFEDRILTTLLEAGSDAVPYDSGYYDLEELKISVNSYVRRILPKNASRDESDGSTIGMFMFSPKGGAIFLDAVVKMATRGDRGKWFEDALNTVMDEVRPIPVDICGMKWIEVDTPEDLKKARQMFGCPSISP